MRPTVLFICHAGNGVGLGHLMRSLVASKALVENLDLSVEFIAVGDEIDSCFADHFPVEFNVVAESVEMALITKTRQKHYSLICLDLYQPYVNSTFEKVLDEISSKNCRIVAIDNLPANSQCIDLLYIPSFSAPKRIITSRFGLKVVYGWDCYLLNIEKTKNIQNNSKRLLVLTGGSDVTKLGLSWPKALNKNLPAGVNIDWVTGPFSEHPSLPENARVVFVEHIAPKGLNKLIQNSMVATTVFGVSFFELIALGLPTVVFSPYGSKDLDELSEIEHIGVALVAKDEVDAVLMVKDLLIDERKRDELTKASKAIMKDWTGKRFASEIIALL